MAATLQDMTNHYCCFPFFAEYSTVGLKVIGFAIDRVGVIIVMSKLSLKTYIDDLNESVSQYVISMVQGGAFMVEMKMLAVKYVTELNSKHTCILFQFSITPWVHISHHMIHKMLVV